jgi:Uma2 family endonuclease
MAGKAGGRAAGGEDRHRDALAAALRAYFADLGSVYVGVGVPVLYGGEGSRKRVVPDVMVVRGVGKRDREEFRTHEEGRAPQTVFEITGAATKAEDAGRKLKIYRDELVVSEYILFDPAGAWLDPPLQGYRRTRLGFVPMRPLADGRLESRALGLLLAVRDGELALTETATMKPVVTPAPPKSAKPRR